MIIIPIHEGEARGRGQLSFDSHGITILYHRKYRKSSAGMISYPEEI